MRPVNNESASYLPISLGPNPVAPCIAYSFMNYTLQYLKRKLCMCIYMSSMPGCVMVTHQLHCKLSTCQSERLSELLEEDIGDVLGITLALEIHQCEHLGEGQTARCVKEGQADDAKVLHAVHCL